jgi:hypothetical protein
MKRHRRAGAVLAASLIGATAGCSPKVSHTGYVGTWVRGSEERAQSRLSIVRDGERYRVRWNLASVDGRWKVTCDWEGPCVEYRDGEQVAEFRFNAKIDAPSGNLIVECNGRNLTGEGQDIHWVDEFVLGKRGLAMVARALVQGDRRFEGQQRPRRRFTKVSDQVDDPPRGG